MARWNVAGLAKSEGSPRTMAGSAAARPSLLTRGLVEIEAATPLRTGPVIGDHGGRCKVAEAGRSEERRVGKECVSEGRSRWSAGHYKKHHQSTSIRITDICISNTDNNTA